MIPFVLVVLAGAGTLVLVLRASLPALDGRAILAGLTTPVAVERDALGVVTLRGASRIDLARATGYVHAQDRFFQMDLARRRAAGELAELFGVTGLRQVDRAGKRAEQVEGFARGLCRRTSDEGCRRHVGLAALAQRPGGDVLASDHVVEALDRRAQHALEVAHHRFGRHRNGREVPVVRSRCR